MPTKRITPEPKIKTPESGVLKACLDLLAAEGIWHRRWNTGAVKTGNRFYRFGQKGDGDILAIPMIRAYESTAKGGALGPAVEVLTLRPLWIECKSSTGKLTPEQKLFRTEVTDSGHEYLLVRDVDTLRNWLKENGVLGPKQARR